jgi:hypothetical protein
MTLNEQTISRKGRIYYHGSAYDSLNKENARFPYFFITTNLFYAINYSRQTHNNYNKVYEVHINKVLNIFNANHSIDKFKIQKRFSLTEFQINDLQRKDWYRIDWIKDLGGREKFVEEVKKLGYDGFFNFEFDRFNPITDDEKGEEKNPSFKRTSMGIFDINNLSFSKTLSLKDLLEDDEFKKKFENDIKFLKNNIKKYVIEKKLQSSYTLYEWLYLSCDVLPFEELKKRKDFIDETYKNFLDKQEKLVKEDREEFAQFQKLYEKERRQKIYTFSELLKMNNPYELWECANK